MKQGIVICTWYGGQEQFYNLTRSLKNYYKYPIYVIVNDASKATEEFLTAIDNNYNLITISLNLFELGALEAARSLTDLDEFFFLHDTCYVKDKTVFSLAFEAVGTSISYGPYFSGYIGKYRREILDQADLPLVLTKDEAVKQEFIFTRQYASIEQENLLVLDKDFRDGYERNHFEDRFGRKNLVLEGHYIRKYQGTYGPWIGDIPQ
jgi:hypothetical protein